MLFAVCYLPFAVCRLPSLDKPIRCSGLVVVVVVEVEVGTYIHAGFYLLLLLLSVGAWSLELLCTLLVLVLVLLLVAGRCEGGMLGGCWGEEGKRGRREWKEGRGERGKGERLFVIERVSVQSLSCKLGTNRTVHQLIVRGAADELG